MKIKIDTGLDDKIERIAKSVEKVGDGAAALALVIEYDNVIRARIAREASNGGFVTCTFCECVVNPADMSGHLPTCWFVRALYFLRSAANFAL